VGISKTNGGAELPVATLLVVPSGLPNQLQAGVKRGERVFLSSILDDMDDSAIAQC
jgi:hypothetical protein